MNTRFYHAKILTLAENHRFEVTEGELWVEGDTIRYVGDGTDETPLAWDREIDAEGNLLIPGFKNAHTHTGMTFLRSYADDLPLHEWLHQQVFPREGQLTEDDVYWLNILGIMEYLTSGITSNFDMYFFPPVNAKASADTGFRTVQTSGLNNFGGTLGIMEYLTSGITSNFDMYFFPPVNAKASADTGFRTVQTSGLNNFGGTVELMEENYHIVNELSDLTSFIVGFHAEYTTSRELMEGVARLAQKLKSPVWLHNSETKIEVDECKERWGMTPTQLTDSLGMYEYGGGGYHCVWVEEPDFEIFKRRGLTAVTNPASNLKLASGICPVKRFVDEGIAMAIGTDGPASNNCLDMFREMFLTSTLAKVREMDAECVGADEILYMATAGGAHAMQLFDCDSLAVGKKADISTLAKVREMDAECVGADEILYMATAGGAHAMQLFDCDSLAVGKKADIVMIDLKQPNMQPENNLVKNLVYSGSKQNVKLTMVNGRVLYENQSFSIGFDPAEIYARANAIIGRMK